MNHKHAEDGIGIKEAAGDAFCPQKITKHQPRSWRHWGRSSWDKHSV